MFLLNFQLGKLPLQRSESFHCTLLMQKPSIDALMTMTLLNIGSATVTRSGITTHQHTFTLIPQDLSNACTRSHTEVQTHTHTHKVRKELTVSIKTRVDCFNGCFKKSQEHIKD